MGTTPSELSRRLARARLTEVMSLAYSCTGDGLLGPISQPCYIET